MSEPKTQKTGVSPLKFLKTIEPEERRRDSYALMEIFSEVTGETPHMWGSSIVGFGQYHFKSERSRQEGDWPLTGFSPRKQALTLYLLFDAESEELLTKLGPHTRGKVCLYIKRLSDVDTSILRTLIRLTLLEMKKRYP